MVQVCPQQPEDEELHQRIREPGLERRIVFRRTDALLKTREEQPQEQEQDGAADAMEYGNDSRYRLTDLKQVQVLRSCSGHQRAFLRRRRLGRNDAMRDASNTSRCIQNCEILAATTAWVKRCGTRCGRAGTTPSL